MTGVSTQENITTITTAATSPEYCSTVFSLTQFAATDSLIIPLRMFCSSSVDLSDIFLSCLLVHTLFCHHARQILPTKPQVSPAVPSICPTVRLQGGGLQPDPLLLHLTVGVSAGPPGLTFSDQSDGRAGWCVCVRMCVCMGAFKPLIIDFLASLFGQESCVFSGCYLFL